MDRFWLTRQELANVLRSLEERGGEKPSDILRHAWTRNEPGAGQSEIRGMLRGSPLPPIAEKLMRCTERRGFSLHEIADLGHLLEFSTLSVTSMQNWVKRDFKMYFHCPQAGKKYSLNQTALLLMIDDLKANLDFESIRRLFAMLFCESEDNGKPALAGITPLSLFDRYTSLYQALDRRKQWESMKEEQLEQVVWEEAAKSAEAMPALSADQKAALHTVLFVAVISIQAARLQALARHYCQAALYMRKP
ncbi:DUF1836 domain-containing protein [Paenibacillus sp. 1011MAR3C5]|uniref:DUF1836 domain-containing protein n=1 Tax=Paenibacillus sp. 1011MAR3C5 TaxID=1675787 RepID=UPI000E6C23A9|nr:DUF1836 domain-containing protein [Paenibacillus sp. 1011MAR3C5]RJE90806.1 DUF1836 domain-containing protein [Paenibacillus sp. 1011MAR3C5]